MNGRERVASQVVPCADMTDLMVIVGGSIRLEILRHLFSQSKNVSRLAQDMELAVSTVSRSLGLLRENGLVEVKQHKKNRIYSLGRRVQGRVNGRYIRLRLRISQGEWLVAQLRRPARRSRRAAINSDGRSR